MQLSRPNGQAADYRLHAAEMSCSWTPSRGMVEGIRVMGVVWARRYTARSGTELLAAEMVRLRCVENMPSFQVVPADVKPQQLGLCGFALAGGLQRVLHFVGTDGFRDVLDFLKLVAK